MTNLPSPGSGVVYTETVVHSPPAAFASEAPYQIAIITLDSGRRMTVRILEETAGERTHIGDRVEFVEFRNGIPYFRKTV